MSEIAPVPPETTPPPRRRGRWGARVLLAIVVIVLALAGAVAWLLGTEQGARFVLSQATRMAGEGVKLEGVEGRIGGVLRIDAIEVNRPDMYARIEGFEMESSPLRPLQGVLHVHRLRARSVEVRTADAESAARVPVSFAPPYPVRLDEGSVGELRLGELSKAAAAETDPVRKRALMDASRQGDLVVRDIYLRGEGDESAWRIEEARAQTPYGKGSLAGTLQTDAPFALDMKAAAEGVAAERPYRATLTAKGTLKAIEARLQGEVSGQPLTARALLEPFAATPVKSLEVQAKDFDLSRHANGPRTRLALDVRLAGEAGAFAGPVRVENADPGPWDRQKLPFTVARARVVVRPDRVDVLDLAVALVGGGSASGRAQLQKSGVQADLRVADVDLSALHGELQKTRVTGRVSVAGDRTAQKFDLALKDPRFDIDGRGTLASQRLEVQTVTIRTGGGSVTAKGGMQLAGGKEFRFEGSASHFDPSAFVKTGKADLNFGFVASGTLEPMAGELRAQIAPSTYAGLPASGRVLVAGDAARVANADVNVTLGEARVTAKGSYGRTGDALDVTLRAPNIAVLARPFGVQAAGRVDADARLTGTFRSPAGRIALTGSNLVLPTRVHVRELALRAEAGVEPGSPIDATLRARGIVIAHEEPATPFADSLDATLKGTRLAHRLEADARMTRETRMRAAFQGGLDPRAGAPAWNGRVESLEMIGPGAFALTAPATLHASASRVELGDATLKGDWGEARLMVTRWTPKSLELRGASPGILVQNVARALKLDAMPRSSLVVAGDWDVRGLDTLNGTLNLRRVSGDLRVGEPPLPLGLQELVLKVEAVRGRATGSLQLAGERVGRIQGEGAGTIVRGKSGWELAPAAPVQARLVAEHTNLEALSPWLGIDARLGGRVNANVAVSGTGADPRVSGEARAQDLTLREPQTGLEIEQGQVMVRMAGRSITIERFTAVTPWKPSARAREAFKGMAIPPSGTISAEGGIDLGARTGGLRVRAQQAVLTQLPSRFVAVSGEARLDAAAEGMVVKGNFKADAGWVGALDTPLPTVSDDVVVIRKAEAPPKESVPKQGEKITVDARFALGEHFYFEGRGLDTRLVGEIRVTGQPGAALRATGAIRTEGGTYKGYGQNLTIERGVLQFAGALDNPRLNVLAVRKGLAVEPGVEVLGSATRPRVRLVSTPDVPEPEKLSWLVLGRGPSDLAPGDASVLLAAATAMLGRNNPGADMGKRFGVDEVRIGRADTNSILGVLPQSTVAGKTGSASAAEVVSVGKKITRDVHLTYEQGLADAEGALKIAWQITRRFQLLARAGYLPGLDAVYRWTFR